MSVLGSGRAAYSADSGQYAISGLSPGRHVLQAVRLGFAPSAPDTIVLGAVSTVEHDLRLRAAVLPLSAMVITPGSFSLLDLQSSSQQVVTREALLTMPQLAEDLFRSLNRLPGLSGSDFTAKVRIRNGGDDEQLFLLDGMELVEPFHLKDFDGALSILDAEAIGRVELTTGGFGAAFGNRTTGLIQLGSANPVAGRTRSSLGLSLSNARARSEGTFGNGRVSWLASARRGYLDILFKLIDVTDAPKPTYYDLFGKVQAELGSRHVWSAHALVAGDALLFLDADDGSELRSTYDNMYGWSTLRSQLSDQVSATSLVSVSRLTWRRRGVDMDRFGGAPLESARIDDDRRLTVASLKQDWTLDLSSTFGLLLGGEARAEGANYGYMRRQWQRAFTGSSVVTLDSQFIDANLTPSGSRLSGYASLRLRPAARLTTELGARADRHSWTGETTVTPRFNVAFDLTPRTSLRGAWGLYAQAQGLQDLSIVDGDTAFVQAELAEQRVLSVQHEPVSGITLRAEAFERRIRHPRPRWYNTDGDLSAVSESQLDRIRLSPASARVRGVELLATYDIGGRFRANASYSRSKATADFGNVVSARPYDEPQTVTLDLAYRTAGGWTWAFAWTSHGGWPHVPAAFVADTIAPGSVAIRRLTPEPLFTERLHAYHRIDLRLSRSFTVRRGQVSVFADIFNVFDRANQRGYEYNARLQGGNLSVDRFRLDFLPRLPALGVRWDF